MYRGRKASGECLVDVSRALGVIPWRIHFGGVWIDNDHLHNQQQNDNYDVIEHYNNNEGTIDNQQQQRRRRRNEVWLRHPYGSAEYLVVGTSREEED